MKQIIGTVKTKNNIFPKQLLISKPFFNQYILGSTEYVMSQLTK